MIRMNHVVRMGLLAALSALASVSLVRAEELFNMLRDDLRKPEKVTSPPPQSADMIMRLSASLSTRMPGSSYTIPVAS